MNDILDLIDWANLKYEVMPRLPEIEFKKDGIKYKATDLRYIRQDALKALHTIIEQIETQGFRKVVLYTQKDFPENEIDYMCNTLITMEVSASKCGKGGWSTCSCFLVSGYEREINEEGSALTFYLAERNAKVVYDYKNETSGKMDYYELCERIINEVNLIGAARR